MSYYYTYYLGYKHNGKIYPLGPYDCFGKLRDVINRSRSFASDLHERFSIVKEEEISDELRKEFEYTDWNGEKNIELRKLALDALPSGEYIRKGYALIEDVKEYEEAETGDTDGLFCDFLTPTVYAAMAINEKTFGKPPEREDCEGNKYIPNSASDYMYYAYPDYRSESYEAFILRTAAASYEYTDEMPDDAEIVILLSEG